MTDSSTVVQTGGNGSLPLKRRQWDGRRERRRLLSSKYPSLKWPSLIILMKIMRRKEDSISQNLRILNGPARERERSLQATKSTCLRSTFQLRRRNFSLHRERPVLSERKCGELQSKVQAFYLLKERRTTMRTKRTTGSSNADHRPRYC